MSDQESGLFIGVKFVKLLENHWRQGGLKHLELTGEAWAEDRNVRSLNVLRVE